MKKAVTLKPTLASVSHIEILTSWPMRVCNNVMKDRARKSHIGKANASQAICMDRACDRETYRVIDSRMLHNLATSTLKKFPKNVCFRQSASNYA